MNADIYICSKPLQYFNIRNIEFVTFSSRKVLVVFGSFIDAEQFVKHIKEFDTSWDNIVFLRSHFEVYTYLFFHPANNLFVEIDASFVYGILYKLGRFKKMYVFEEGFGSYRRDRFDNSRGLKKWINKHTGVGDHVGFSSFLTGQYLYLPDLYKKQFPGYEKLLLPFYKSFIERVQEELPLFLKLSDGYEEFLSIKNKRIGLYLTNHQVNDKLIDALIKEKNSFELIYIKPHPHIKTFSKDFPRDLAILRSNIMIEFLMMLLLNNNNQLTVFHENSTAVIWFQNVIINKNMGARFEEYEIVATYIKSYMMKNAIGGVK